MKITGYREISTTKDWGRPIGDVNGIFASGITPATAVVVETDAGIEGVGLGHVSQLDAVFPALEGQDPRAVTTLYDAMLAHVFKSGHQGAVFGGIGAFDTALWDLKAKCANEPLWRLLGAADRWIPGYASGLDFGLSDDDLARFYRGAADRGFQAAKVKGGRSSSDDIRRLQIAEVCLRSASPKPALMLDANEAWNLKEAVRHLDAVEQAVELWWIEEPLRRWDVDGHARLSTLTRAAVATGENLTGLEQFAPFLNSNAVDIVQTGAAWGITHFLRLAHAAHAVGLPISPVGLSANPAVGHAAAAVPNHLSAEVQSFEPPRGIAIDEDYIDGGVLLTSNAGTGTTIDEGAIDSNRAAEGTHDLDDPRSGPHVRDVRTGLHLTTPASQDRASR